MATRQRSPNYPAYGLEASIDLVRRIYSAEKRASIPYEAAARALGYGALGGRVRVKIATLRKFGLLDEKAGRLRVSDLAIRVLFPRDESDKQAAMEEAASRPDVFRVLRGNAEGSDATLVNDLIQRGYTPDGARGAVNSFRETMNVIGPSSTGYDEPEAEDEPMIEAERPRYVAGPPVSELPRSRPAPRDADYAWPLPDGVRVELRFAGGPFTKDGLRVLRKYLDVLEEAIPDARDLASSSSSASEQPSERSPLDVQD